MRKDLTAENIDLLFEDIKKISDTGGGDITVQRILGLKNSCIQNKQKL